MSAKHNQLRRVHRLRDAVLSYLRTFEQERYDLNDIDHDKVVSAIRKKINKYQEVRMRVIGERDHELPLFTVIK